MQTPPCSRMESVPGAQSRFRMILLACLTLLMMKAGPLSLARAETPATASPDLPVRSLSRDNLLLFHDAQGKEQPVRSVQDWEQRRAETLRNMEAVLGKLPGDEKRCPLEIKVLEEIDAGSYIRRKITYQSEPNSRVPAYLLIPKSALQNPAQKAPAALCLHSTSADGPKVILGLTAKPDRQYGQELAERGYVVLAPNYPWLSEYEPDLKSLGWESGTLKAVWDNIRGLDLFDSLPYVKTGQYAAIGHSLGGHNSVYTALYDNRIKVIVSSCGLDSYVDYYNGNPDVWLPNRGWVQTRYIPRLAGYRGRLEEIPFDFQEMVASLAPRPVLIIAPKEDSNFRMESVDRVVRAALPIFKLYRVPDNLQLEHPDGGHNFPAEMRERAYRFIDAAVTSQP